MKLKAIAVSVVMVFSLYFGDKTLAEEPPVGFSLTSIGHACEGLLVGYARNPSQEELLLEIYSSHIDELISLYRGQFFSGAEEALGIVTRGLIVSISRNPALTDRLNEISDMCGSNIRSISNR